MTFYNHLPNLKWRCVFAIAYFTGSRISEVLALDVSNIQSDRIVFVRENAKTNIRREIAIQPQLQTFLESYPRPKLGYMFPAYRNSKRQTHVSRQAAHKVLSGVVAAADGMLDGISTHSFRRSFATNLAKSGRPQAEISRLLGHRSTSTTSRYIG